MFQIPHLKKKKKNKKPGLVRVCPGRPGPESTHRVARVWPGCYHSRSFVKPGPVQPPGRPGPGSTRRAGPGLITMLFTVFFLLKSSPRFLPTFCPHLCCRDKVADMATIHWLLGLPYLRVK